MQQPNKPPLSPWLLLLGPVSDPDLSGNGLSYQENRGSYREGAFRLGTAIPQEQLEPF